MTAPIDYQAVLADLEAKREQLDAAIAGVRLMLGAPPTEPTVRDASAGAGAAPAKRVVASSGNAGQSGKNAVETDTFFGLSTSAAVKKFLALAKRPQTPRAIADALHEGGQVHAVDEKTAYTNVYTALKRGKDSEFSRTRNGEWGLAEWYSNKPKDAGEG